ncbi:MULTISPECIES: hypothetical protein [Dyella]|uniref:Uncharacterized protein n=2 Tax=Dyella TaxID=231454 RepID=A0A4R0YMX3_9GAMM|nr:MULTISPECIES: hypothetical protein [Dyella]TBR36236.1 hypothetical protein EYV96_16745 [Dyella terrae]TCI05893.1 hypothetical protein EZM97_35835 [Dyella soli]
MDYWIQRIAALRPWQRWTLTILSICVFSTLTGTALATPSRLLRVACIAGIVGMTYVLAIMGRAISCGGERVRKEDSRYMREIMIATALYMVVMLVVWPLQKHTDVLGLRYAAAISPLVPLAMMIRAMVRYVMACDEFMQRMNLLALSWATGVVAFGSMAAGFLSSAKLIELDGTAFILVYPAMCIVYGLALAWNKRRYS